MRKLTLALAAAACVGLAAPAFAAVKSTKAQNGPQAIAADQSGQVASDDFSARGKKKKKVTTGRSSWGG